MTVICLYNSWKCIFCVINKTFNVIISSKAYPFNNLTKKWQFERADDTRKRRRPGEEDEVLGWMVQIHLQVKGVLQGCLVPRSFEYLSCSRGKALRVVTLALFSCMNRCFIIGHGVLHVETPIWGERYTGY